MRYITYSNDEEFDLLEIVVISPNTIDIKEDALNLFTDYAGGPFPILEQHFIILRNLLLRGIMIIMNYIYNVSLKIIEE